jgi:hypothetical protein
MRSARRSRRSLCCVRFPVWRQCKWSLTHPGRIRVAAALSCVGSRKVYNARRDGIGYHGKRSPPAPRYSGADRSPDTIFSRRADGICDVSWGRVAIVSGWMSGSAVERTSIRAIVVKEVGLYKILSCLSHSIGNCHIKLSSARVAGCRPSKMASRTVGASKVRRSTRPR